MSIQTYVLNTQVRVFATVRNLAGTLTTPTSCTFTIERPDGSTATVSGTVESTGVLYTDILLDAAGAWLVSAQAEGGVVVAGDATINVRRPRS